MKKSLMIGFLAAGFALMPAVAMESSEAEVRAALEHYLMAHATGDSKHLAGVFNENAKLFWVANDTLAMRSAPEYLAGFSGKPAADEAQRRRRIVSVDVTGRAASGKIELDYPSARIIDYMSLLKINGEWQIVNKIVYSEPKAK